MILNIDKKIKIFFSQLSIYLRFSAHWRFFFRFYLKDNVIETEEDILKDTSTQKQKEGGGREKQTADTPNTQRKRSMHWFRLTNVAQEMGVCQSNSATRNSIGLST